MDNKQAKLEKIKIIKLLELIVYQWKNKII